MRRTRSPGRRQAGFIISMEAVLVISILGIGLFVGLAAVRNALFKYYLARQDLSFVVYDSSTPPRWLGTAVGFDAFEAPLLPFVDYGVKHPADANARNLRALVGVRNDRFTSHQPVFYSEANCTGTVCIAQETSSGSGAVAALYAMQDGPVYAVGAGLEKERQGALYRSSEGPCVAAAMLSKWVSQQRVPSNDSLCFAVSPALDAALFQAAVPVETTSGSTPINVLQVPTAPFYVNGVNDPLQTAPRAAAAEGG